MRAQVALEHGEFFAVFKTDDVIVGHRALNRDGGLLRRLRFFLRFVTQITENAVHVPDHIRHFTRRNLVVADISGNNIGGEAKNFFSGHFDIVLQIGKVEELWDEVAIAMYPDRAALLAMSTSKEWRELSVHRTAGLAGQLNIETVAPAAALAQR